MRIEALLELSVLCLDPALRGWVGRGPSFLFQGFDNVQDVQMFPSAKLYVGPFSVSVEDCISIICPAWGNEIFFFFLLSSYYVFSTGVSLS